ncbi:MAG: FAD-dependent oxidoreductase [Ferruginibacter sp.]|nr:FAD-dependent oxidoreductase [Bacteroidota bacterium]MBX2920283.1 FAD-dependent oxidoreductase [Ferruginibacter sp.]MCB0708948.1 FAD-dependent oxidoreductase [Chitinophagaceae bacterium]
MKVSIIGGGIIGLCSAYFLEKEGYEVTIIERGDITDGCSFGNMGFISPSHFIPLANPGVVSQGLKWMMSSTSPFYIKPRLNLQLVQWGYHFWKNCTLKKVQQNSKPLHEILQLSRRLIETMRDELGNVFEMQEKGCLMICKKQKTLDHEFEMADEAEKFGLNIERLNREAVQALEPNVEVDVAGAVLFKDDCHFDPSKLMRGLFTYLQNKKTVQFQLHTTVTGFEKMNGKITSVITDKGKFDCDEVVLAPGSWMPELAKMMGIKLLLQPGKGYSYTYQHIENNLQYPAILVDGRCAISPWGAQLRIGGTMELSGINNKILVNRMRGIFDSAKDFYPGLQIDFPPEEKIWSGLRPVSPDGLPYIGRHPSVNNVVFAGGHAMLGLTLASGTGKLVKEIVHKDTTSVAIDAFKINRFG